MDKIIPWIALAVCTFVTIFSLTGTWTTSEVLLGYILALIMFKS